MTMQYMDPQDDEYYHSYSQQKLHPPPRRLPKARTVLALCLMLLCLVFVAAPFIGTVTPQNSLMSIIAGWIFLLILFFLALWAFARSFIFGWPRHKK